MNGKPATVEDLAALALCGYGSFTSLVVVAGRVQGLDLHLHRLQHDADTLFGAQVDEQQVRRWLRETTADTAGPVSARITLFQRDFNMARPTGGPPDVLITTRPAPTAPPDPMRVATTAFVRDVPEVKHTGLFAQLYHRRTAQARGFDDVLFLDAHDHVSEGATWNIAFSGNDGTIQWPQADVLPGVTMHLLRNALPDYGYAVESAPVRRGDIHNFPHAFATNAIAGIRSITAIDDQLFTQNAKLEESLRSCWTSIPAQEL
ncbi:aminotransferase class IV [Streptomyces sp. NBC_00038]|uniref:aminotransferase class IV n=1 Tax=Streptomyces sp. NBC_00038 TaxID=2903615 RepID=UPI002250E879|nr:aminotransferase class IV [Streptomyces sp. NBC_00038]MCX5555360.1 aminotransferase class IV [Streptomyces sp. NBC_00038]